MRRILLLFEGHEYPPGAGLAVDVDEVDDAVELEDAVDDRVDDDEAVDDEAVDDEADEVLDEAVDEALDEALDEDEVEDVVGPGSGAIELEAPPSLTQAMMPCLSAYVGFARVVLR